MSKKPKGECAQAHELLQHELLRICTKVIPDHLLSPTSLGEKGECHNFRRHSVLDLLLQAPSSTWCKPRNRLRIDSNPRKPKTSRRSLINLVEWMAQPRRISLIKRTEKSENEVNSILGHAPRYQQPYGFSCSRLSYICTPFSISNIPQSCHISTTNGIPSAGPKLEKSAIQEKQAVV